MTYVIYFDIEYSKDDEKTYYGAHGYTFEENGDIPKSQKPAGLNITDKGYIEPKALLHVTATDVIPLNYIDWVGCTPNDADEITSVLLAFSHLMFELFNKEDFKTVVLYHKSKIIKQVLKKLLGNINNPSDVKSLVDSVETNKHIWRKLSEVFTGIDIVTADLDKKSVYPIEITSSSKLEDSSAPFFQTAINNRLVVEGIGKRSKDKKYTDHKMTTVKNYWNQKIVKPQVLLDIVYIFAFEEKFKEDELGVVYDYIFYPKDDFGRKTPDATYGFTYVKERIKVFDTVLSCLYSDKTGMETTNIINKNTIYSPNVQRLIARFGDEAFRLVKKGKTKSCYVGEYVVGHELYPAGLSSIILSNIEYLRESVFIDRFIKNINESEIHKLDITKMFYEHDSKGKKVFRKTIINDKTPYRVSFLLGDYSIKVPFITGKDLPDRNTLKRLENRDPEITCFVISRNASVVEYFFITILKNPTEYCMISDFYTKHILIKNQKR